jgi:cytochrome c oxidase subunit 2
MPNSVGRILAAGGALAASLIGTGASAGEPTPWQMGLQQAATPLMQSIDDLHDILLVICTLITLFVLGLLLYVMWRFRESKNPTPTRTTHNTTVEVLWTVIPVVILVLIAIPSFKLLYYSDTIPKADLTVKAIGHQWYWSYEYPDHGNFTFDATILADDELKEGQPRLLEVDNRIVVPVDKVVRVQVTADDVLHAWAVPAFGVKTDGVPGRLNEVWFKAERTGVYYGQCSELCGVNHGFMPIRVDVVTAQEFNAWISWAKKEYAADDGGGPPATKVARIESTR